MKRKTPQNKRLSSDRELRRKYFIQGVVKRGTNQTWVAVRSWVARIFRVAAVLAVIGGIGYAATLGWKKLFWLSPDYALRDIQFTTDGTLSPDQARTVGKIKLGANIYSYTVSDIRDALRAMPQIESVDVRRYPPNRIDIAVKERKPTAWLALAPTDNNPVSVASHLLDASGIVFQPKRIPHEFKSLPVITGVQTEDLEPGKPIRKTEIQAALDLLRTARDSGALMVKSVDVSKGCFIVVTDQRRAEITIGLEDIAGQLERLARVRGEAALIGQDIQTINLIPTRNIPVTFIQPVPADLDDVIEVAPTPHTSTKAKSATGSTAPSKEKSKQPSKREEPAKPKEAPKGEKSGLLKQFRTA